MSATELLTNSLANFINIYLLLIFIRLILSWFQTADFAYQAISFLSPITDPYLNIFRSFIPPLGGIDLSPILAIIVLQLVGSVLTGV
ncbi:MAG: YggT family protein [Gloeocapsa sp. DLM2.Bin57]|nr:MAG: YggT family protein [Gloeocapsa sp. DLM2.Bin57]